MPGIERTFVLSTPDTAKRMVAFVKANAAAAAEAKRPLVVTITEFHAKRSDDQNRKLHAMIRDIAEQAWVDGKKYPQDVWKELIKIRFIGAEEVNLPDGRFLERGISTTKLSVSEFADLITKVQVWASEELGVDLT